MSMIDFLKSLNGEFKSLCDESFLFENNSSKIKYPYVVYSLQSEDLEDRQGFYIDVDIYDNCGANTADLEILQQRIIAHFKRFHKVHERFAMFINFQSSNIVPTMDEMIKHRVVQLYLKLDWRD